MYVFAFLSLEHFYANTLTRQDANLVGKPLIVHHEKRVWDANAEAIGFGASLGMALSEAKALLHGGAFVGWEPEPYRDAQTAWLDLCTDVSDVIEPEHQHAVYLDLSMHPDPESILDLFSEKLRSLTGCSLRFGLAGSKWIAKVMAEAGYRGLVRDWEAGAILAKLPTRWLLPVEPASRERLRFLGYRTIGEIAGVPLNVLRSQFGSEGLTIHQAANGGVRQTVEAVYPEGAVSDRVKFDDGIDNLELLDEGLRVLARKLSKKLRDSDRQGSELRVVLNWEDRCEQRSRKFMKPIHAPAAILTALKLLVGSFESESLLYEIRAFMPNLKPTQRFQRELNGAHSVEERRVSTDAAFTHIRTVFGDSAIQVASERKEPRRKQVLRIWKDVTGWA